MSQKRLRSFRSTKHFMIYDEEEEMNMTDDEGRNKKC